MDGLMNLEWDFDNNMVDAESMYMYFKIQIIYFILFYWL